MRSCGSFSSASAHITFCTLIDVLRPQILSMALPQIIFAGLWLDSCVCACPLGSSPGACFSENRHPLFRDMRSPHVARFFVADGARLIEAHNGNPVADRKRE